MHKTIKLSFIILLGMADALGLVIGSSCLGLDWANDNTIFVSTSVETSPKYVDSGLLLELGTE